MPLEYDEEVVNVNGRNFKKRRWKLPPYGSDLITGFRPYQKAVLRSSIDTSKFATDFVSLIDIVPERVLCSTFMRQFLIGCINPNVQVSASLPIMNSLVRRN